jgi:hypothetical protein
MTKWTLTLSFSNGMGIKYNHCIDIDEHIASDIQHIEPLNEFSHFVHSEDPFAYAVEVLKRRRFRKDLFIAEAERLGRLLAQCMEDKEAWHGERRQELIAQSEEHHRAKLEGNWAENTEHYGKMTLVPHFMEAKQIAKKLGLHPREYQWINHSDQLRGIHIPSCPQHFFIQQDIPQHEIYRAMGMM